MAAPVSRAGSAVWTGDQAGREATVDGERAVSPGPELSPLEPRPSPLAAGEGSEEGRALGRICVLNSRGDFSARRVGGPGMTAGEEDTDKGGEVKQGAQGGCRLSSA